MLFRYPRHKNAYFVLRRWRTKPKLAPWSSICVLVISALKSEWYGRGKNRSDLLSSSGIFTFPPDLPSQGMLALVLNCVDRLNVYNSVAHFAGIAREENGMAWKEILNLLYKLLGKHPRSLFLGRFPRVVSVGSPLHKPGWSSSLILRKPFANRAIHSVNLSNLLYFPNLEQEVSNKWKQMVLSFANTTCESLTALWISIPHLWHEGTKLKHVYGALKF